jgi:glycosyltransferase involved in cell wall biosynthesis
VAERSLQSIRSQTFPPFEILAVDLGCPKSDLARLTGQDGDECLPVISGAEGIAEAWNAAAAQSTARYICFLRPGDEIEETYLEKCLFHLEVASLDVCGASEMRGAELYQAVPFTLSAMLAQNVSVPAVIRREPLLRAGGFDREIVPPYLAWDLWIRLAEQGARGRLLPEPLIRKPGSTAEELPAAAFVSQKYRHLLSDAALVRRLDAIRCMTPALNSYADLLEGASRAGPQGIIIAKPFLTMGGAERAMAGISGELTRREFRVFLVTTEAAPQGRGDTSGWFRNNVAGIYQLAHFLAPALRLAFLTYLIQRHSIRVLWQVGSKSVYQWLPRLKELFEELAVVDLLFNPVGHADSHWKSRALIDHVVVEHEGMASWLTQNGEQPAQISVIPNGVDVNRFAPQPPRDWRTGGPRREGAVVVGFFGRLDEEKAPDTFVRIAAQFKDRPAFQFLICGTGPVEMSLRSLCQEYGLEETVHFLGFVDTSEFLPCCHLTVTCSRFDGRPNIILESLAMGIPVVASRVGGIPEMAPEGNGTMLCEPGDLQGFCRAIEQLAADREGCARLGAAGRRWVASHDSLAAARNRYADLFRGLTEARPAPARSVDDCAAIALAMLPVTRPYRALPGGRLRASLCILRNALSWSNMPGAMRTAWLYLMFRRVPALALAFDELFDPGYYALNCPDVIAAGVSPVWHYLLMGFRNGSDPSAFFDTEYYLEMNPDVAATGLNPLVHYIKWGRAEHRGCLPAESLWSPYAGAAHPKAAGARP